MSRESNTPTVTTGAADAEAFLTIVEVSAELLLFGDRRFDNRRACLKVMHYSYLLAQWASLHRTLQPTVTTI
jgi:hypothetical protein